MNKAALRWSLVALILVVGMVYALWPRNESPATQRADGPGLGQQGPSTAERRAADTPEALAPLRQTAGLDACPTPSGAAAGPLTGITLECIGDGSSVDLGQALAGRPALLNIWAYWCGPCAKELPYLQQYAQRAGDAVTVLTVHNDANESNGLNRLAEYGVTLPGVQDGAGRVAAAVGAPNVLPVSVLISADGTVAKVLPQPFRSVDDIADAVRENLGVSS